VASETRKTLSSSFGEDLDRIFGEVEVLLATFEDDENIKIASIKLLTTLLKAIEDSIGFFLSNQGKKLRPSMIVTQ
jgi:hypothetical protein